MAKKDKDKIVGEENESGVTKVGDKLNLPLGIAGSSWNSQHT